MVIKVSPPKTIEEFNAIEWLQAEIWSGTGGIVPAHLLITFAKEGGSVLLARDGNRPIGFAFGFLAATGTGQLKLASHQAGVLPAYQNRGAGYQIKLAQREEALARGLTLITWTFDPLQSLNARFNLRKLGAVCNSYIPNLYGTLTDAMNRGLPSDRFKVSWWINSHHVIQRLTPQQVEPELQPDECPVLNPAQQPLIPPDSVELPGDSPVCMVEIPTDLTKLKKQNPELALTWRLQTREIFSHAFANGYTAIDLLLRQGRAYYLLQKDYLKEKQE